MLATFEEPHDAVAFVVRLAGRTRKILPDILHWSHVAVRDLRGKVYARLVMSLALPDNQVALV